MVEENLPKGKQKQIAISEFFEKNKHFLGFDSLQRSLITAVKEAVDNSLDACEDARIKPDISVEIKRLKGERIELIAQDNGPGIPRNAIEHVFGKFLLGSRFHAIRQTRGQQGIGITGVVMYSQLTTGSKTSVISKIEEDSTAVYVDLGIDTRKNKATKSIEKRGFWPLEGEPKIPHGLRIRTEMKAKYQRGRQSVYQYLRMTSIVNPHATISLIVRDRDGSVIERGDWPRTTDKLPRDVKEIKPHPRGIEMGTLQRMLADTTHSTIKQFMMKELDRFGENSARRACILAEIEPRRNTKRLKPSEIQALVDVFQGKRLFRQPGDEVIKKDKIITVVRDDSHWSLVDPDLSSKKKEFGEEPEPDCRYRPLRVRDPDGDCLSPIEELLIKKGLSKAIDSRFASTVTRAPSVTQGSPFQVEVGLVFGGDLASDSPIEILRFANRVPLMYQQGGCLLTKAIESVDWKRYGLDQPGGKGVPKGPAAVLIHLASTNVQFTSEAKEAVASNEEVLDEIRRALLGVGRGLKNHLKRSSQMKKAKEKFELINVILPEISKKSSQLLGRDEPDLAPVITKIMNAVFCEEELGWDSDRKLATCNIIVYNYTARARAYTILAKWPESETTRIEDDSLGGRKEANGLWKWRLDTLNPGSSTTISFGVKGLSKGEWLDTEVFFRGNGNIIGANKIDEELLKEMRNKEALDAAVEEARVRQETVIEVAESAEEEEEVVSPKDRSTITAWTKGVDD